MIITKAIVTVKKTQFITNLKGNIAPLFHLNSNKEIEKLGVDSLIYKDFKPLLVGIGKGAKLKIDFDEHAVPTIKTIIKKSDEKYNIPEFCPTCRMKLIKNNDHLYCSNLFCQATSRGFIYRLFNLGTTALLNDVTKMLNKYPVTGSTSGSIDSIAEFQLVFDTFKHKDTQPRLNHWKNLHGDELGEQYWKTEGQLNNYLHRNKLSQKDFWITCNFKNIPVTDEIELWKINPQEFLDGNCRKYVDLPTRARELVDHNMDFVMWLNKFFNGYGDKTWTSSIAS